MKNPIATSRKSAALFGAAALALTLIGTILRIINLYFNFEIEVGYYYSSAILVDIMHVFFLLSVIGIGILALVMVKKISLQAVDGEKDPTAKVLLCFLGIAALVYIVAKSYFDVYFALNSPNKILLHMACLAAMFLFLTIARLHIGALKEKSYLFFLASTVFLSGVYAIPSIYFCIISKIYREYTYLYFDIFIFAVFIFAMAKLITLTLAKKPVITIDPTEETDGALENTDVAPSETENTAENTEEE